MKKILSIVLALMLVSVAAVAEGEITVLTREDGSGTLSAFTELFGIEEMVPEAIITNSTAVMMTTVQGNPDAIGYISLGSLNETVKALTIDGVEPSVDTILSGEYTVSRPFNIATGAEVSEVAQDFINFILSEQGQAVILENGYIPVVTGEAAAEETTEEATEETTEEATEEASEEAAAVTPYASNMAEGNVVVSGSSSVTPVMEKLIEAYATVNPNATVELQQSDSTTGMNNAMNGVCDIGMASRALKDSELEAGLVPTTIAMDGIAVIVNNENTLTGMTSEQVTKVFTGEIWKFMGEIRFICRHLLR